MISDLDTTPATQQPTAGVAVYHNSYRIGVLWCDEQDKPALKTKILTLENGVPMSGDIPAIIRVARLMVGHDGGDGKHYGAKAINGDAFDVRRCNIEVMFAPKIGRRK